MNLISTVVATALLFSLGASGQEDWGRVRAIPAGQKVRVQTAGAKHEGAFVSASDASLTLRSPDAGETTLTKGEIRRVYAGSRSHRLRNTIIGAAVGVGVGAVLYGTLGSLFRNEGHDDTGYMLAVPIAVGTGIGAALPTGGMKKIYDAGSLSRGGTAGATH